MTLQLTPQERDLLLDIIDSRIKELHPEIRRCQVSSYRDQLKEQLSCFESLLQRLKSLAADSGMAL